MNGPAFLDGGAGATLVVVRVSWHAAPMSGARLRSGAARPPERSGYASTGASMAAAMAAAVTAAARAPGPVWSPAPPVCLRTSLGLRDMSRS
jgi:hypothetical protein